jgi:DNA replication and repair protein RecF
VQLRSLRLRNHRNYAQLDLIPGPGVNVFIGPNGQGKTNLLEAVAMLALSTSPRARRELELIGPVAPVSRIEGEVESGGLKAELAITLTLEGERTRREGERTRREGERTRREGDRARRVIEVDGVRRRAFDLPGRFRVTLFWPDDLGLVKAGPELRRRFLNQMLVQIEPGYARALAGLKRVLEQRNSLLKRIAAGEEGMDVLEAFNQELVRVSVEVVSARSMAVRELEPEVAMYHAQIAGGERLEIHYEGPPENLAEAVHNSLGEDLRRGSTTVGPHHDDLRVLLGGRDARSYGSQGQQRTAVVSLKLAEAALVARRTGERPVLLLDDVLSELDSERRSALLSQVAGEGQVVITSVEAGPFPPGLLANARVWTVDQGRIQPCG